MRLEQLIPLFHAFDLMLFASMSTALGNVSLGPLAESGGDLFDTLAWIVLIVTKIIVITNVTSLSRTAVGKAWVVVAALVISRGHTIGIVREFGNPALFGRKLVEPLVQDLLRELNQLGQTLGWGT